VRALASQSGRAPGVYPSHRLYLLTGLLTRLIGTEKTERDAEDGHRAIPQVSETRRDVEDAQDARRLAHNPTLRGSPAVDHACEGRERFSSAVRPM